MAVATLKFSLPEERSEYNIAVKGIDYYSVLWELSQELRNRRKYGEVAETTWDEVEELFWKTLSDANVTLDEG